MLRLQQVHALQLQNDVGVAGGRADGRCAPPRRGRVDVHDVEVAEGDVARLVVLAVEAEGDLQLAPLVGARVANRVAGQRLLAARLRPALELPVNRVVHCALHVVGIEAEAAAEVAAAQPVAEDSEAVPAEAAEEEEEEDEGAGFDGLGDLFG